MSITISSDTDSDFSDYELQAISWLQNLKKGPGINRLSEEECQKYIKIYSFMIDFNAAHNRPPKYGEIVDAVHVARRLVTRSWRVFRDLGLLTQMNTAIERIRTLTLPPKGTFDYVRLIKSATIL